MEKRGRGQSNQEESAGDQPQREVTRRRLLSVSPVSVSGEERLQGYVFGLLCTSLVHERSDDG